MEGEVGVGVLGTEQFALPQAAGAGGLVRGQFYSLEMGKRT